MDPLDILGQVLWFGMFAAPVVTLLCIWRLKRLSWFERIALGLVIGIVVAFIFYGLSLRILFRDGMGP